MKTESITVSGTLSEMTTLRESLIKHPMEGVSIEPLKEPRVDPLEPAPLGLEPIVYFVVCFSAHISAALVHDYIKQYRSGGGGATRHKGGGSDGD